MALIDNIILKAKTDLKTIVLPEGSDSRILRAASEINRQSIARIIILENKEKVLSLARNENIDLNGIEIIDIETSANKDNYINTFYELRKHKGITMEDAGLAMSNPVYWGTMMVKVGDADGMVAGAITSTGDVMRPALQIVKTSADSKIVTTFFLMEIPNSKYGHNGLFAFADCALIENPDEEQLSYIAILTAKSFKQLTGVEPIVAMLSYSSHGSAVSEFTQKVVNATKLVKKVEPNIIIDGELQVDTALVEEVAKLKAPSSIVAGKANVLIFPDLNSGNISYKLVQRLANATSIGPLTQGLAKPINDLSRGCSVDDIIGVVALTAVQCQNVNRSVIN